MIQNKRLSKLFNKEEELRQFIGSIDKIDNQLSEILTNNSSFKVRETLARQTLSENTMEKLSKDEHYIVRETLALNPYLPKQIQLKLINDEKIVVKNAVLRRSDFNKSNIK